MPESDNTAPTPAPGEWELPSAEELTEMLPQYDITELLGKGGMGAVFKGRQAKLDRDVAIKLLFRSAIESDEEMMFSERFQREAKAMAKLDHPNIVSVFDFGETHDGQLYLVMEFIDGMDIHEYLQHHGGSLPQKHALSITAHVLDALGYAHSRGIVHRDIKPANILLNQEGRVKIADFGLAKKFGEGPADSGPALTMENTAVGTPDFVAPEALESGKEIDHRADLYAVGVMLYQMLTGKLPRGVFKMPSELNPELDVRLDAIIEKSLEADPEYRYSSASLVRADIDQIISGPMSQMQVKQEEEAPVAAKPKLVVGSEADAAAMNTAGSSRKNVGKKRAGVARKKVAKKANKAPFFVGAIIAAAILVGIFVTGKNKIGEGLSPEETREPGAVDSTPQEGKDNKPKEAVSAGNTVKPSSPSLMNASLKSERIDLLGGIDLKKDVIQGDWEWDGKRLITKNTGEKQRSVRLRKMQIPDEYDLNLHIERLGESGINVVFMMSGHQAVLVMEQWAWFIESIDGKTTKESPAYEMLHTTPGDKFDARLEVRKDGLAVFYNDEEVLSWKGEADQIGISEYWTPLITENDRLFLATNGLFAVDKIELTPIVDSTYSISNPFENSLGMRFVPVPITGGPTGDKDILFSIWETRVKDYQAFVDDPNSKVSKWEIPTRAGNAEQAAGNVTWQRADLFCEWLTEKERRQGLISSNLAYRLPTDHEWSAAAGISNRENVNLSPNNKSEGIKDVYLWGKKYPPPEGAGNYAGRESEEQIWAKDSGFRDDYMDAFSHVAPVGAFQANEAGLFDLGGNVWEWCWDLENARKQQGVARRVRRGGSYRTWNQNELLSSHRAGWGQTNSHLEIGFRVVLGPPLKE